MGKRSCPLDVDTLNSLPENIDEDRVTIKSPYFPGASQVEGVPKGLAVCRNLESMSIRNRRRLSLSLRVEVNIKPLSLSPAANLEKGSVTYDTTRKHLSLLWLRQKLTQIIMISLPYIASLKNLHVVARLS